MRYPVLLLILILGALAAFAAPATTPNNNVIVNRDPRGQIISEQPNPEASNLLFAPKSAAKADAATGSIAWKIVNTILQMLLVLVIVYVGLLGYKRFFIEKRTSLPGIPMVTRSARLLQSVETLSLGQGRSVHLITVGTRRLLLGAAAQQVTLLADVTDDAQTGAVAPEAPLTEAAFSNLLSRFMTSPAETPAAPAGPQPYAGTVEQTARKEAQR